MKKLCVMILSLFLIMLSSLSVATAKKVEDNGSEPAFQQDNSEITSRITTYNMHAGIGMDGNYDLDRIANTIRETGADIIGLQEVDVHWGSRSNHENTIKQLAEKLNMEYFFAPIYDLDPSADDDPRRQYGVAVLSKYPILNAENRQITRLSTQDSDPAPRPAPGFLEAQINIDGANVWFYVTHLDYRSDPTVREMQVTDMFEIMSEHNYNILVGDMNAPPEADELKPLFNWFDDAWDVKHEGPGHTYPAESPVKRIDYIFTSPRMKVNETIVYPSMASDHLPVSTEVTLVKGNHSLSTRGMQMLIDAFEENGAFSSVEAVHTLKIHLEAVNYYERNNMAEKVVKHLRNFKLLLDYQKENDLISEKAYTTLYSDAAYLIGRWKDR